MKKFLLSGVLVSSLILILIYTFQNVVRYDLINSNTKIIEACAVYFSAGLGILVPTIILGLKEIFVNFSTSILNREASNQFRYTQIEEKLNDILKVNEMIMYKNQQLIFQMINNLKKVLEIETDPESILVIKKEIEELENASL